MVTKRRSGDCEICSCYANPPASLGDPWVHRTPEACIEAIEHEMAIHRQRLAELEVRRETIEAGRRR